MPNFTMRWANRSNPGANQDWILAGIVPYQEFTLHPDHVAHGNLNINADGIIQISVNTDTQVAAANLTYTAATHNWTLTTFTPHEFHLATGHGIVTVRCLLTNAAAHDRIPFVVGKPEARPDDPPDPRA